MAKINDFIEFIKKHTTIPQLITAFFLMNSILLLNFLWKSDGTIQLHSSLYTKNINIPSAVILFVILTVVLSFAYDLYPELKRRQPLLLLLSASIYFYSVIYLIGAEIYTVIGILAILALIIYYISSKNGGLPSLRTKSLRIILCVLFLFTALFIGAVTVLRYLTFSAPNFDFGIFTQMYEYMRTDLVPNTTTERDMLLSHFAVHISPIYYVILPVYMIFPNPITLQVSQAVIVAAAIFPLYKLCRVKKLPNIITLFILIAFAFYPPLSGGCMYDIHENMFLTTILMWLFYFLEKATSPHCKSVNQMVFRNSFSEKSGNASAWVGVFIFMCLALIVKEDAPLYVGAISAYIIFGKKKPRHGTLLLALSVTYLIFAVWLLAKFGQGVMLGSRFGIYSDEGFLGVIKTIATNPIFVLKESATESKGLYLMRMMLPLCMIPLLNNRKNQANLFLFAPMLLINLMPSWPYQHDIGFQYNFGNCAIFFYLFVMNFENIKSVKMKKFVLIFSMTASIFLFTSEMWGRSSIIDNYKQYESKNAVIRRVLYEEVPVGVSVSASSYFIPHLYKIKELHELSDDRRDTDYIVIDIRSDGNLPLIEKYEAKGYEITIMHEKMIAVMKK